MTRRRLRTGVLSRLCVCVCVFVELLVQNCLCDVLKLNNHPFVVSWMQLEFKSKSLLDFTETLTGAL